MEMLKHVAIFAAVVASILAFSLWRAEARQGEMRLFMDLLFTVGGIMVSIGCAFLAGIPRPRFEMYSGYKTEQSPKDRRDQIRHGMMIIVIYGLVMIALSVAVGTLS